jgi:hypothetical protein
MVAIYILFRLYSKRNSGYGAQREIARMRSKTIPQTKIMNISNKNAKAPLNEYIIKGSYNSACSGEYFSSDAIQYVLSRGCRWLDFEVFYDSKNEEIFVSKTIDPSFNITPKNSLSFIDAMTAVISNAFSSLVPNNSDPLFIQIRPKSLNENIYSMISATIISTFGNKLYGTYKDTGKYTSTGIDTKTTYLSSLNKKVIIVLDVSNMVDFAKKCQNQNQNQNQSCNIFDIANLTVGDNNISKTNYKRKIPTDHTPYATNFKTTPPTTDIKKFEQIIPDDNSNGNMNIYNIIFYYFVQLTPGLFYYNDEELYNYEILFEEQRSAFVPLGTANKYIKTTSQFNS